MNEDNNNNNKINYVTVIYVTCDVLLSCAWIYIIILDAKITSFNHESSSFIERDQNNKIILPSLSFSLSLFKYSNRLTSTDIETWIIAIMPCSDCRQISRNAQNADSIACKFSFSPWNITAISWFRCFSRFFLQEMNGNMRSQYFPCKTRTTHKHTHIIPFNGCVSVCFIVAERRLRLFIAKAEKQFYNCNFPLSFPTR